MASTAVVKRNVPAVGVRFGDKGSAYAIGVAALAAVAAATDHLGPKTALDGALRDYLISARRKRSYPGRTVIFPGRIAELSAVVTECAQQKDEVASRIIAEAAIDLAAAVEVVVRGLDMLNTPTPIVLSGNLQPGLFSSLVSQHINSLIPSGQLIRPNVNPAVGAATLALRFLEQGQSI
ncbi:MAG: BadF/BadG/BcrA/BcrD ATPase family protein [Caldilineaceae bacterium]